MSIAISETGKGNRVVQFPALSNGGFVPEDLQQYEITIEDGDRKIAATIDDTSIPQPG
jgi:hypothetical protein